MNIIVDESVDHYFVRQLRFFNFSVVSIIEELASISDEDIISLSLFPPSVIITEDKDFGDLVFKSKREVFAVVLLRYDKIDREVIFQRLLSLITKHSEDLPNSFSVINYRKTRIRKLNF